ncbi:MAG: amidohydrolase [Acidobacteria bacterium]|nr:amidohydrolase [Acidobacteriota bacterium]
MSELETRLAEWLRASGATIRDHRRALHEIPERGYEEHETSAYLQRALASLGIGTVPVAGTGLVAELPGSGEGPTVMLRSDMDGLPIAEDESHEPRSRRPGFMHACGHDGHMSILLGVADAVAGALGDERLPGRLLLLFQPAEESSAGAARVVEEGTLERHGVDYVLGLHLWSFLEKGRAIVPDGTVMASADEFRVVLKGKGGHGALPHEARDVVVCLSHLVLALQGIVSREIDPLQPAVLSIGRIRAGDAANVLPERGELFGTFRAPNARVRGQILRRIGEMAEAVGKTHDIEAEVEFGTGYPPTVNDAAVAGLLRSAAADVLGAPGALPGPQTMAAEDFAMYLQRRPGAFMLLGMRDEAAGIVHPHHCAQFQVAEDVLPLGAEILLRGALRVMQSRP